MTRRMADAVREPCRTVRGQRLARRSFDLRSEESQQRRDDQNDEDDRGAETGHHRDTDAEPFGVAAA